MYFSFGFPRALNTGLAGRDEEAIYCSNTSSEFILVVFRSAVQVWSGSQHRVKLGEVRRSQEQVQEEGPNVRAHWCPQKRALAVSTQHNHLHLYALNQSSEALWRLPDGQELRRVNVYLSHAIHLDYGAVRIADLGGDAKSLLVALSNGTMQVFSWQGKLRGQANPFIAAYEGSRSRRQQSRTLSLSLGQLGTQGSISRASPFVPPGGDLTENADSVNQNGSSSSLASLPAAAAAGGPPSRSHSGTELQLAAGGASGGAINSLLAAMDSLPLPTPAQPAEVAVERIHYVPAARMVAVVLRDGRCALCRTADSGIHPVEQVQLFRWVYKPSGPEAPAVVAAALNPTAQLLALGLSNGRVAIYTLQSLLSVRHARTSGSRLSSGDSAAAAGGSGPAGVAAAVGGATSSGAGQPEPSRALSLADWGYRSSVVGPASALRWSPDGRVVAVGYAERGIAVWTPSGCRLMCSLRQAVATGGPSTGATASISAGAAGTATQLSQPSVILPPVSAAQLSPGMAAGSAGASQQQQQEQTRRSSTEGPSAAQLGSPGSKASPVLGGLWSQNSSLNPGQALEPGVLEHGVSALAWSAAGYQLLVAESGQGSRLHTLEFARHVQGSHRAVQQAGGSGGGPGLDEVHALQAADRILLITETRQTVNPALKVPLAAADAADGDAAGVRPDLSVQHVKLPQQYIDAAYPLLHAAISQDCADVAVAGTRGLAVYSRRSQRWRLFGDATQEKSLRVQSLVWLPGGVIAVVAFVDGRDGGGAPQLLLYPQYHLDNVSLLARLPLKQVPVAMDSVGWHLVLAFAPLEIRLYRVTVEGPLNPSGRPIARLTALRELSIMGLGNPLQEIALIDPGSVLQPETSATTSSSQLHREGSQEQQQQQQQQQQQSGGSNGSLSGGGEPSWPQLKVSTRPQTPGDAPEGPAGSGVPQQCVILRAGGIMSKLDLNEGSEVLLSDAIERFWLPVSAPAAGGGGATNSGGLLSRVSSASFAVSAAGRLSALNSGAGATPGLTPSSSGLGLPGESSDSEPPAAAAAAVAGGAPATRQDQQQQQQQQQQEALEVMFQLERRQAPRVEMPWWTYGARGMQLWFPSSLSEPLTPSLRTLSIASPTATGLAAAAAAAATNSTDPELEFDREVYPIGVSLAEVSIIGVLQRTVRSTAFHPDAPQSLCLHPLPESQPVLPCLLRRLLQKGRQEEALELARWHSGGPHFNRSLEWLLFTALELDAEQRRSAPGVSSSHGGGRPARQRFNSSYSVTVGGGQAGEQQPAASAAGASAGAAAEAGTGQQPGLASPGRIGGLAARQAGPLLVAAARLISQFPQFPETVVSVARKTDAALWPSLFAAVGSPARMCQGLLRTDKLQSAACCLVIVEQVEGSSQAQAQALQLIQAALKSGQYGLVSDLLRFLVPPGEGEAVPQPPSLPDSQVAGVEEAAAREAAAREQQQQVAQQQQQQQERDLQAAAVPGQQQAQQQQQPQQAGGSWFWGLFGGTGDTAVPAPGADAAGKQQQQAQQQQEQQQQAGVAQQQQEEEEDEEDGAAAAEAWRLTAHHAWRLLDSGALREVAQLARCLTEIRGGLPALLAATAADAPAAQAHFTPSAAAIASALFVAANEFAAADAELEAALAAEQLLAVCQEAGCINLATALALLLGDQGHLGAFADAQPGVWAELHNLIANDVHLCGYAPMLSPLPSPMVAAGGASGRRQA